VRIFISHSKRDRWVAKRISEDLIERGLETFLDEKDIETGASIKEAIQGHLEDCDEALLLLSPMALKSEWVLIEIGGARALRKRLVPILFHVGANDLPDVLRDGLARDLNEIDAYYEEVVQRARHGEEEPSPVLTGDQGESQPEPSRRPPLSAFEVGDLVHVPEQPQPIAELPNGMILSWNDRMTAYAGKRAAITHVNPNQAVRLDVDGGNWWWAQDWLESVEVLGESKAESGT
jgi:hypothetical protein